MEDTEDPKTLDERVFRDHVAGGPFQSGVDLKKWSLISYTALAQAREVLPTPPLPVKSRKRVEWSIKPSAFVMSSTRICARCR